MTTLKNATQITCPTNIFISVLFLLLLSTPGRYREQR